MLAVLQWGVQAPKGHAAASCIHSATSTLSIATTNTLSKGHTTMHVNARKSYLMNSCPIVEWFSVTTLVWFARTGTFFSSCSFKNPLNNQLCTNSKSIFLLEGRNMSFVSNFGNGIWIIDGHWRRHSHSRSRVYRIQPVANILKHPKRIFPPKSLVLGQMFHDIRVPVICSCDLTWPKHGKFNKPTTAPQI